MLFGERLKEMLEIKSISINEIPEKELKDVPRDIEYISLYKSKGMFDKSKNDYLFIIESEDYNGGLRCFGYVYNGTAPECSEFGYFGLDTNKTERIW